MTLGMILSGVSFMAAGFLQLAIDNAMISQLPSASAGYSRLQVSFGGFLRHRYLSCIP